MSSRLLQRDFVLIASFLLLTISSPRASAISLPPDFSGIQGNSGVYYEQIGDSRSTNTLNPAPAGTVLLPYIGLYAFPYPGLVPVPTYAATSRGYYPNVQWDPSTALKMSPDRNEGMSVAIQVGSAGLYRASGLFARANGSEGYGDGEDVLIVKGTSLDSPLFSAHITQDHAVDVSHPFAGTSNVPFDLTIPLLAGDTMRFIVFSGPQGQDAQFDQTALQFTFAEVPEPSSIALAAFGFVGLLAWAWRRRNR